MKKIFVLLMMALATCNISAKSNFVQVKDGHFVRDGKPYYLSLIHISEPTRH